MLLCLYVLMDVFLILIHHLHLPTRVYGNTLHRVGGEGVTLLA